MFIEVHACTLLGPPCSRTPIRTPPPLIPSLTSGLRSPRPLTTLISDLVGGSAAVWQVPCAVGGHAGMMDAFNLIGHKQTWLGMVAASCDYLTRTFEL